jgi:hypothetical protein
MRVLPLSGLCRGSPQRANDAALGQFDFVFVAGLRLRVAQRRFGGSAEMSFVRGLAV